MLLELQEVISEREVIEAAIDRHQLDRRTVRRQALCLVTAMPSACNDNDAARTAWITTAREATQGLSLALPLGATINRFFQIRQGDWHSHLGAATPFSLAAATVHEAKGHEYEAVCVLLPPDPPGKAPRISPLLDHWENRVDAEPKRVVYVGITRARQFVTLAVPRAQKPRIAAILAGNAVPFVERDI